MRKRYRSFSTLIPIQMHKPNLCGMLRDVNDGGYDRQGGLVVALVDAVEDRLSGRLDSLENRFDSLENRFDGLEVTIEKGFDLIHAHIDESLGNSKGS